MKIWTRVLSHDAEAVKRPEMNGVMGRVDLHSGGRERRGEWSDGGAHRQSAGAAKYGAARERCGGATSSSGARARI